MIRLDRSRQVNGRTIHPGDDWQVLAAQATAEAMSEGSDHAVKGSIYAHDNVRAALEELSNLKCAYCETSLDRFSWDVEHFRPKGRVKERPDHTGYYWLSYEWTNLLPSCTICNQNRKEKPVFDGTPTAGTGGKLDQFPIADETHRAMEPGDDLEAELCLLIDPAAEDPDIHFGYLPNGSIFALNNSPRGQASIDVFRLDLVRIRRRRRSRLPVLIELMKLRQDAQAAGHASVLAQLQAIFDGLAGDDQEFAGQTRYFLRNPDAIGLQG